MAVSHLHTNDTHVQSNTVRTHTESRMIIDNENLEDLNLGREVLVTQNGVPAKGFARARVVDISGEKTVGLRPQHRGSVRSVLKLAFVDDPRVPAGWRVLGKDPFTHKPYYGTRHPPFQIETL